MKKHKCHCCKDPVSDLARRFDKVLGYVCPECYKFSAYADECLALAGVEGSVIDPERSTNNQPEAP